MLLFDNFSTICSSMYYGTPIVVSVFFIFFIGFFVFIILYGIGTWIKNKNSPILTVDATVVAKRGYTDDSTHRYYVTFQVESGDRMELYVGSSEYGLLVEGDKGKLTFQGSAYKSFDRTK